MPEQDVTVGLVGVGGTGFVEGDVGFVAEEFCDLLEDFVGVGGLLHGGGVDEAIDVEVEIAGGVVGDSVVADSLGVEGSGGEQGGDEGEDAGFHRRSPG